MRIFHRIAGVLVLVFALYLAVTGSWIQIVDLAAITSHRPADDPNMLAIRESINGQPYYEVIAPADYSAPDLPQGFDFHGALDKSVHAARAASAAGAAVKWLEFRMVDNQPVVQVLSSEKAMRFNAMTAAPLNYPQPRPRTGPSLPSQHLIAKNWHRLFAFGDGILWLNMLAGIALFSVIVAGLILYVRLYLARARLGKGALLWSAGGGLRTLHRGVSIVAAVFLLVVSVSGTLLAFDSFYFGIYRQMHHVVLGGGKGPPHPLPDYLQPLTDDNLRQMLTTTLSAAGTKGVSIRAVRLRIFSGMPQGVVITGEKEPRQLVFNAVTGRQVSMTEPGYPEVGFPFGWEEHELMKRIHRGDAFGLPGRFLDLFAGLSLIFLTISGAAMYLDLWLKRRRLGRKQILWI